MTVWDPVEVITVLGGAQAGAQGGVNGSPVAGGVGVFAGEVKGVLDGGSQFVGCVKRTARARSCMRQG